MPSHMVKMKFMPLHVEHRLVNKWGYVVQSRVPGQYIMFKKSYISDSKEKPDDGLKRTIRASVKGTTTTTDKVIPLDFKSGLSTYQKKTLERRCDNIVTLFPDPYAVPNSVRARLTAIMSGLSLIEAQFVLEYMDENFPALDDDS